MTTRALSFPVVGTVAHGEISHNDAQAIRTIAVMPVYVDETLPLHPLSVANVMEMVRAGILDADDRVELLDGVLVEMSPQGSPHAYAIRRLNAVAAPIVTAAGLELSIQAPLDVGSPISLPEPDLAIVPSTERDRHPTGALLVVEMGATSLRIDLVRKARIYATGNVPEYWVLDVKRRALVVHREPVDGCYTDVRTCGEDETVMLAALDLSIQVSSLL